MVLGGFRSFHVLVTTGFLTLFEALAGGAFDHLSKLTTDIPGNVTRIFQKSLMPGVFPGGEHGLFWNRSVQNADYRMLQTIVFTMQSELDNNSPIDCFLTLKIMVCIQSAVCTFCTLQFWNGLVH